MANKYVYSGATGSATGDDWTNVYTGLATGLTNVGAGDILYLASDHSETFAGGAAQALTVTVIMYGT